MGFGEIATWIPGMKDPIAELKEVVFRPSTAADTLRVGDLVCYNWDATTDHEEKSTNPSSLGATYAEGSQNYTGRLLLVEKPATANLQFFAGVVASLGPLAGADGDRIQIYVPNGAVVPVMIDQDATNGRTIIAVRNDAYEGSYPSSSARPIGIAMETVSANTTDALCWVKVDPSMFLWQYHASAINIDDEGTTSDHIVNKLIYTTAQTGGNFTALWIQATSAGGAAANGYGLALYVEADITAAVSAHTAGASIWMNITGGTQTKLLHGLEVGMYHESATLTSAGIFALSLRTQIASAPANHYLIRCQADGSDKPDGLLYAYNGASIGWASKSGSATFNGWIPIKIDDGTGVLYIPTVSAIA